MRIDKLLSDMGISSRKDTKKAAARGEIILNGEKVKTSDVHCNPETDEIIFCGRRIEYKRFTYIMLNKPSGYVSATDAPHEKTVLSLLPEELNRRGLFPCGRLDKDTVGLLVLTNDGQTAHDLLSPARHVEKSYRFSCSAPLSESDINKLEGGVEIGEKRPTKSASIEITSPENGIITISEGKYHQIKRMFEAIGNKITFLERITFATLALDKALARGEWRFLTETEISVLLSQCNQNKI